MMRHLKYRRLLLFLMYIFVVYSTLNNLLNIIKYTIIRNNDETLSSNENSKINATNERSYVRDIDFDNDVLAFIHIQKTGGTYYENHVFKHLMIETKVDKWEPLCAYSLSEKRYKCKLNRFNKSIYWDRYITGNCDVHSGHTEVSNCVMLEYGNRIFTQANQEPLTGIIHMITMLRDPIKRYISEFNHIKNARSWIHSVRICNDQQFYKGFCPYLNDWYEFILCHYNLARNRQTRMLANYNKLGCRVLKCWTPYENCTDEEKLTNERQLLESAKETLNSLSFFGLTEYQSLSEYLFEKTFKGKMKFSIPAFQVKNFSSIPEDLLQRTIDKVNENNRLDIELYEYAKKLFFERVTYFKSL